MEGEKNMPESRGGKILSMLKGNVKKDDRNKINTRKKIEVNLKQQSYIDLFDEGKWEELDTYLRKNPLDKSLKRRQLWGKEYINNDSIPNRDENSPPLSKKTKIPRKRLFDCTLPPTVENDINGIQKFDMPFSGPPGEQSSVVRDFAASKENLTDNCTTLPESPKINTHNFSKPEENTSLTRQTKFRKPLKDVNFSSVTKQLIPLHRSYESQVETSPSIETLDNVPNNINVTQVISLIPHLHVSEASADESSVLRDLAISKENCCNKSETLPDSPSLNTDNFVVPENAFFIRQTKHHMTIQNVDFTSTSKQELLLSQHNNTDRVDTSPSIETLDNVPNNSTGTQVIILSPNLNVSEASAGESSVLRNFAISKENLCNNSETLPESFNLNTDNFSTPEINVSEVSVDESSVLRDFAVTKENFCNNSETLPESPIVHTDNFSLPEKYFFKRQTKHHKTLLNDDLTSTPKQEMLVSQHDRYTARADTSPSIETPDDVPNNCNATQVIILSPNLNVSEASADESSVLRDLAMPKENFCDNSATLPESPNLNTDNFSTPKKYIFKRQTKHHKTLLNDDLTSTPKQEMLVSQHDRYTARADTSPSIETPDDVPNNCNATQVIILSPNLNVSEASADESSVLRDLAMSKENFCDNSATLPESPNLNTDNFSTPKKYFFKRQTKHHKTLLNDDLTSTPKQEMLVSQHDRYTARADTSPSIETPDDVPNNCNATQVIILSPNLNVSEASADESSVLRDLAMSKENFCNNSATLPESPNLNTDNFSTPKKYFFTRQTKHHKTLHNVDFASTSKQELLVSQHNRYTACVDTSPSIETLRNMPNNCSVTMVIPVSPHLSVSTSPGSADFEENLADLSPIQMVIAESPTYNIDYLSNKPNSSHDGNCSFKHLNKEGIDSQNKKDNFQQKKICANDTCKNVNDEINCKKKRKWDRKNFCVYCHKLITNFSTHMKKIHSNEESVMKYCAILDSDLRIRKQRRQAIFDDLRKQGNFLYNQQIVRESITPPTLSMLLPVRRRRHVQNDDIASDIYCKVCLGLFTRKTFYRHASKCGKETQNEDDVLPIKNSFIKDKGLEVNLCSDQASEILKDKIFPLLRKDQKGIAAITDPLIVSVASDFLSNHTSNKDKYNVTNKMRDAGALLLEMKKRDPTILNFNDCFDVTQIDNIISSVQELSQSDLSTGTVGVVGMPARLSWVIHESCSKIIDNIITNHSLTGNFKECLKTKIMDFQRVIRRRWKYAISTNAEKTRKRNAMKKETIMPDDKDIKMFLDELNFLEQEYSKKLRMNPTCENYEHLCEAIIAKLIVINRRRSGEVSNAELEFYIHRRKGTISDEIVNQLSVEEKSTLNLFDVFLIPGKIVRAVPILLSKATAENIDLLISCRSVLGIHDSNKFLFARPGTENPFVGAHVMRKFRNSFHLKNPAHMTATGLRHHCATMSHVHSKNLDKEDLAEFMGHSLDIHKKKYRYPLEVIQRGKIAPHLLKLGGVNFNEIQSYNTDIQKKQIGNKENENTDDDCDDDQSTTTLTCQMKCKTRTRWTEEEKAIVIENFKEFIKCRRNPGKHLCTQLILKEPLLKSRSWAQINVLVDNFNKGKASLPLQYKHLRNC